MTTWLDAVAAGETAETNGLASMVSDVGQMAAALASAAGAQQTAPSPGPVSLPHSAGPCPDDGASIIALLSQTLSAAANIWAAVSGSQPLPAAAEIAAPQMALVNDTPLQVLPGGTGDISSSLLSVSDGGYAGAQLIYTVTTGPAHGMLLDNGEFTTRFTQVDLDSGALTYRQDGSTAPTDTFAFTVTDPTGAAMSGTYDIGINIPSPPVATDFYGDGTSALMLAYSNGAIADMPVHDGALAGGATYLASASDGWNYLTTADFDGDGSTDLLLMNGAGQVADYAIRNGAPVGAPTDAGSIGGGDTFLATGAFNGAGSMGVLVQDPAGNIHDLEVKNGAIDGTASYVGTLTGGWKFLAAGDFNGDGTTGILVTDAGGDINEWTIQNGMFAGASELTTLSNGWQFLGTGDFHGSGSDDLLFGNLDGEIVDRTLTHGALGSPTYAGGVVDGWKFFGTGDFNGDGTTDIAVTDGGGDIYEWMMKNGSISGAPQYLATVDGGWHAIPHVG